MQCSLVYSPNIFVQYEIKIVIRDFVHGHQFGKRKTASREKDRRRLKDLLKTLVVFANSVAPEVERL
jgi:hypothetical protein